ncbi:Protein of uncharacterised function (DUF732) [Mycobacteroides abscessus subsp. bolletii]|nr:Protein of uncharacterised function (DUF732) [Mycobacteroides abscessus subsp. bolletii]SKH26192.1 Protein of uncharacterised function (DUF732) [Mycobacteroides abscessus subsp. bolletii]
MDRVVVALGVLALIMTGCNQNESSERGPHASTADDQADVFAQTLTNQYGIEVDSATAADIANVACDAPLQGVGLYQAQQALAQRHPEINRTNPNAVGVAMSAAVLAYCPERLP